MVCVHSDIGRKINDGDDMQRFLLMQSAREDRPTTQHSATRKFRLCQNSQEAELRDTSKPKG